MKNVDWKEISEIAVIVAVIIGLLVLNVEYIKSIRDIDYVMFIIVAAGSAWASNFATRWYYKHVLKIDTTKKEDE